MAKRYYLIKGETYKKTDTVEVHNIVSALYYFIYMSFKYNNVFISSMKYM